MKRKIIGAASLAFVAAASLALTSCNQKAAGAGEKFEMVALDALKEEKVSIEFWHSFGDAISAPLNDLVEQFQKDMAEKGYKISVKVVNKGGGYDGLRKSVNMGTKSGAVPTLILGYPDHFADYIKQNILLPLDDYVNDTNEEIGINKTDFVDSYWAENQMVIDGGVKTAGLPFNKSTEVMYYNSSLVDPILDELGFTKDAEGTWDKPTWDEVFAVSKYIKDNAKLAKTDDAAKQKLSWKNEKGVAQTIDINNLQYPTYVDSEANFFITTSRQWGGEGQYTVQDTTTGVGTVVAKNDSNKTAMEYFISNATNGYFNFPKAGGTGSYGSNYMTVNKAAISIGSTAGAKNNASNNFVLKTTTVPQKDKTSNFAIQQGTNLAILTKNSNNKMRLAAWLLMKYLTESENTTKFSSETGYLPVRKSARDSQEFKDLLDARDPASFDYIFNGAVATTLYSALKEEKEGYFFTDPAFNGSSIVRDELESAVQSMFIYKNSFDKAMDAYYTALKGYKINVK